MSLGYALRGTWDGTSGDRQAMREGLKEDLFPPDQRAIATLDEQLRILHCTAAWARHYGVSPLDVIGHDCRRLPGGLSLRDEQLLCRALRGEELRSTDPAQGRFPVSYSPWFRSDGSVGGILWEAPVAGGSGDAGRDAYAGVRQARRVLEALESLEGATCWFWEATSDRMLRAGDLLGGSAEGAEAHRGQSLAEFCETVARADRYRVLEALERARSGQRVSLTFASEDARGVRSFQLDGLPASADHAPDGVWLLIRDVTSRQEAETALRHAERMSALGFSTAGVAHDFNNLVMAISGLADHALADLPSSAAAREPVEEIGRTAAQAGRLAATLVRFARAESARPDAVDVNAVVSDSQAVIEYLLPAGARLELHLWGDLPPVAATLTRVEQVLLNLVINASEAVAGKGLVRVATRAKVVPDARNCASGHLLLPGRYVVLSVSDNGCGIQPGQVGEIFRPFFSTKERSGSGLGLSVCASAVLSLGGAIDVRSIPGQGTTFDVFLPVDHAAESRPEASVWSPDAIGRAG